MDVFENGPFDEREKAVLRLATVMAWTAPRGYVDDILEAQLREYFSDAQIVELGMVCAQLVGMAKLLFVLDWADKEDYCPLAPLPEA